MRRLHRFLAGLAFGCLFFAAEPSHAAGRSTALLDLGPADFPNLEALFYPGAFLVDTANDDVRSLCLPFRGRWVTPSADASECPVDHNTGNPDPRLTFQPNERPPGNAEVIVGNLGLTIDERLGANHPIPGDAPTRSRTLSAIGKAARVNADGQGFTWDFNSAFLPPKLRYEVPGSGLFMHLGKRFAPGGMPSVFLPGSDAIVVSATGGFSSFSVTGGAAATLTMVLELQTNDESGAPAVITLVVGLFNSRGRAGEGVRSDGRNQFVATSFSGNSSFIEPIEGPQPGSLPSISTRMSMKLSKSGVSRLIAEVNSAREAKGASPLSLDTSRVLLKRIDLRNEDRFLDKGDVQLSLSVRGISVTRSSS